MLTMLGGPRRFCDRLTRRETLQVGTLGMLGGLSLPNVLRPEAENPQPQRTGQGEECDRPLFAWRRSDPRHV